MTMTRRGFLSASAGLAVTPALGARAFGAPLPREADIVVIGAGAAGIAAARRVMAANRKVIVVEAAGQIGGRCLTDTATFEVPFTKTTVPMWSVAVSSVVLPLNVPVGWSWMSTYVVSDSVLVMRSACEPAR